MMPHTPYRHITEHYSRLATSYDRRWQGYVRRTVSEALEALHLSGEERVLDVGCGTGELERLALARDPRLSLVGIDVTEPMVAVAQRKQGEGARAAFLVAAAEALPVVSGCFDAVVSCNMLHHLRAPVAFFQECVRVLRPKGRIVLVDWCRDFWHCRLSHGWWRLIDPTYVHMYRLDELRQLLAPLGLIDVGWKRFIAPPSYGMVRLTLERRR